MMLAPDVEAEVQRRVAAATAPLSSSSSSSSSITTVATLPPGGAAAGSFARGQPRLPLPPSFDGRADKLETWASTLRQQFAYYGMGDAQQVQFAAGCLSGAALTWWESLTTPPNSKLPATWAELDASLRSRFQPVTASEIALGQLLVIAQGKTSIHLYVDRFRALSARVPSMDESTRTQLFLRGLAPEIGRLLRMHAVSKLDDAVNAAVRIGSADAAVAALASPSSASVNAILGIDSDETDGVAPAFRSSAPVTHADLLTLINAIRTDRNERERRPQAGAGRSAGPSSREGQQRGRFGRGPPRVPHLTPEEVQAYMEAGKCFGCGATEHQSRTCPKRKIGADGRVSWSN